MLPHSHIGLTLLAFDLAGRRLPGLRDADLRLVALFASGPDLVDKPLAALYFYRRFKSAMLFAHSLLAQLAVVGLFAFVTPSRRPYALAFLLHGLQDRIWLFHDTFWWPLRGWRFHVWRKQGSEQEDIQRAYWHAFTRRPEALDLGSARRAGARVVGVASPALPTCTALGPDPDRTLSRLRAEVAAYSVLWSDTCRWLDRTAPSISLNKAGLS